MPASRKKSDKKSPDQNYQNDVKGEKNPRGKTHDTDEPLHKPYKGYDEKETSNNPYESDFDVDENDINERLGEYSDWNKRGRSG